MSSSIQVYKYRLETEYGKIREIESRGPRAVRARNCISYMICGVGEREWPVRVWTSGGYGVGVKNVPPDIIHR